MTAGPQVHSIGGSHSLLRTTGRAPVALLSDPAGRDFGPDDKVFILNKLTEAEDHRGHLGCWVVSTDWEQHPQCNGLAGALKRSAAAGRADTAVWRLGVDQATQLLSATINEATESVRLNVLHWPEFDNEPHTHVLFGANFTSRKYKQMGENHLRICARLA